jgi:hypothetical protein
MSSGENRFVLCFFVCAFDMIPRTFYTRSSHHLIIFLFLFDKNYSYNRHGTILGLGPPPGRAPRPPGGRSSTAAPSCPLTAFILRPLCTASSRRPCTLASLSLLASSGKAPPTGGPMTPRRRPSRGTPGSTSSLCAGSGQLSRGESFKRIAD